MSSIFLCWQDGRDTPAGRDNSMDIEKLGVPQKRPYLSQVLALLKLPSDVQDSIAGQALSGREMWRLSLSHGNKPENRVKTPGSSDENTENTPENTENTPENTENTPENTENTENTCENTVNKHENRPQTPPSGGYPLLRTTIAKSPRRPLRGR